MKTFPIGGIHPSDNKQYSKGAVIERFPLPKVVVIPLAQISGTIAQAYPHDPYLVHCSLGGWTIPGCQRR